MKALTNILILGLILYIGLQIIEKVVDVFSPPGIPITELTNHGLSEGAMGVVHDMIAFAEHELELPDSVEIDWRVESDLGRDGGKVTGGYVEKRGDGFLIVMSLDNVFVTDRYLKSKGTDSFDGQWFMVMAQTIFHEAVHVQQYVQGRLGKTISGRVVWDGQVLSSWGVYHTPWSSRPWEREAVFKSADMVEKYLKQYDFPVMCYHCTKYDRDFKMGVM